MDMEVHAKIWRKIHREGWLVTSEKLTEYYRYWFKALNGHNNMKKQMGKNDKDLIG